MTENPQEPLRITPEEVRDAIPLARPAGGVARPPEPAVPRPPRTSQMAIASFVFGLLGLPLVGCLLGPIAILSGALALAAIRERADLKGAKWAVSGLILGLVGLIGWSIGGYVILGRSAPWRKDATTPPPLWGPGEASGIEEAPKAIRPALQANVEVRGSGGAFSASWSGSGVVAARRGDRAWIVTNRHVARPDNVADPRLDVHFSDGSRSTGRVAWLAPEGIDVAVVEADLPESCKVPALPLPPPADVKIGDAVFAVGNPLRFVGTYTTGVISQIRSVHVGGRDMKVFQTQAPINPGNSGGGLYTAAGEWIGLVTWSADASHTTGLGFAISMASVGEVLRDAGIPELGRAEAPAGPEEDE